MYITAWFVWLCCVAFWHCFYVLFVSYVHLLSFWCRNKRWLYTTIAPSHTHTYDQFLQVNLGLFGLGLVSFCVCFCVFFWTGTTLFVTGLAILCFCVLFGSCLVVSTSAIVREMTCYVSSGTFNSTHSLTVCQRTCWYVVILFIIVFWNTWLILSAAHTRTSLLRASDGGGHFTEPEFILPETRALLERQAHRKKKLLAGS